jgi:antitoxin (DNA-binding transcriptional repressor) of toxin-antitoxin stability system
VAFSFYIAAAEAQLSRILALVQAGEEVVLVVAGVPVARVLPCQAPVQRQPDAERGKVWMAADFDAPLPDDLLAAFERRPAAPS